MELDKYVLTKREEYLEHWRKIASEHKFFGMEISELDNDMLLSVIGFLCEKKA